MENVFEYVGIVNIYKLHSIKCWKNMIEPIEVALKNNTDFKLFLLFS